VILTGNDFDFAGRPPMQVTLRVTLNGATEDIIVIVMHPKCCSDTASWQRRVNAASALKAYLDSTFPTQKVWVIGDFNDDVDTSIAPGHASPYANFVGDSARYKFPTKALSDAGVASTVDFPDTDRPPPQQPTRATPSTWRAPPRCTGWTSSSPATAPPPAITTPCSAATTWGGGGGGGSGPADHQRDPRQRARQRHRRGVHRGAERGLGGGQHRGLDAVGRDQRAAHVCGRHHGGGREGHRGVRGGIGDPGRASPTRWPPSTGALSLANAGDSVILKMAAA
jgi:hypothetical protein